VAHGTRRPDSHCLVGQDAILPWKVKNLPHDNN
jgi:hypothetical protein